MERNLLVREIDELSEWNSEFVLPACNSPEWRTTRNGFTKVSWDISPKKDKKETDEAYKARKNEFINRIHAVLRRAGKEPAEWFNSFTEATFLGIEINKPIHIELATHLALVESEFARKYGSKKAAAKELGLSPPISGGRGESATASVSMHTFGLALDIQIHGNPYLGGSITLNKKKMDQMKKDLYILTKAPRKPKKMDVLDVIFKRAGLLLNGRESIYPRTYTYATRLNLYDELQALSTLTTSYFTFLDDDKAAELASHLIANNVAEWKGKTTDEAKLQIKKDFDWFRSLVARYNKKRWVRRGKKKIEIVEQDMLIKEKGFLNLDRRLVDELGLDWGATYGDIMHFDMRNKCAGRDIHIHRNP